MTRKITSRPFRTALLGLAALGLSVGAAQAQTVYGLSTTSTTTSSLVTFSATTPGTFSATLPITGVTAGQTLVGIDVRPNTGEVFALGYNPTGTVAQLYTISRTTGAATAIGAALTLNLGTNVARIGFDFNPTVDRIRVTSGANTNFRLNPNNGALAATDGALAYATTDTNAGQTPGIGSSAYTNSYIGSTGTTLYNLDETASRLVTQVPPNNGTLNTVGALGVATNGVLQASDLDIYFNPSNGTNVAYMSTTIATGLTTATSTLYTVNLSTGNATSVGALGTGAFVAITDITVAINRPATLPALTGQLAYALAGTNLITFDTAQPTLIRTSLGVTLPTGTAATLTMVGLDIRPATNTLYGLGYDPTVASPAANTQLYTVNSVTGTAVAIGAPIRLELGTGVTGFDFNPTVDRIRVVGANRNNYRLNPITGALAATDGQVAYTAGTNTPNIGAVAYTNSFMGAGTTSTTTLYNYDLTLNQLNTQATANPPQDGQLTAVGASGITVNATTPNVDLDIFSPAQGTNTAYMVANAGTSANTSLYTVNLATGAATLVGAIGNGIAARNIAIAVAAGVVNSSRQAELATNFSLYPNPLAGAARLSFGLPRASRVQLTVTDALGRTIDQVDAGLRPAGPQTIEWNRKGQTAGMYFFRLSFDGQSAGTRQAVITE
ncbi:DUF4394 domain-containing protein [Hymenobacter norwichensis]|uniref:DUF4394 domain-containing protein n=1 Tax=Hymenobacter norwichensis TaxID=223903 RepID=UPI0003B6F3EF|nr:DUF4394 domain-containing protein [Hymenobacter norwichensis]